MKEDKEDTNTPDGAEEKGCACLVLACGVSIFLWMLGTAILEMVRYKYHTDNFPVPGETTTKNNDTN